MIGAENLEVDLATRYPGPITERVSDIEGNRGIGHPSINETIAKSTAENGNREIRDEGTLEIIRIESSRATQPTRDVNIILSPGDFPEIPEFPDTPPITFGDSPMIPGGEDRSITGEGPERHQEIPEGATHTQSFMTPPQDRRSALVEKRQLNELHQKNQRIESVLDEQLHRKDRDLVETQSQSLHRRILDGFTAPDPARSLTIALLGLQHVQSHKLCTTWPRHMRTMWNIIQISPQHRRSSPQHHRIYL